MPTILKQVSVYTGSTHEVQTSQEPAQIEHLPTRKIEKCPVCQMILMEVGYT